MKKLFLALSLLLFSNISIALSVNESYTEESGKTTVSDNTEAYNNVPSGGNSNNRNYNPVNNKIRPRNNAGTLDYIKFMKEARKKNHYTSAYLRIGGGATIGVLSSGINILSLDGTKASSGSEGLSDIGGLLNFELGIHTYSIGGLYFAFAIATDVFFANTTVISADGNLGSISLDIPALASYARFKLGGRFDGLKSYFTYYALAGAAVKYGISDNSFMNLGVDYGFGFIIGSRKAPLSFFIEASFPTYFGLQTSSGEINSVVNIPPPPPPSVVGGPISSPSPVVGDPISGTATTEVPFANVDLLAFVTAKVVAGIQIGW